MIQSAILAPAVARRLAPESNQAALVLETCRIVEGKGGSQVLDGDVLALAGIIVHVCVVVVETATLVAGYFEMKKRDQLNEVLRVLAERSGDPIASNEANVRDVASVAVDLVNEDHKARNSKTEG